MKAYVDLWTSPDGKEHVVNTEALLTAVRAIPGVVRADWFFTGDELTAIVEASTAEGFEAALKQINAVPDCQVSNVRLVRSA